MRVALRQAFGVFAGGVEHACALVTLAMADAGYSLDDLRREGFADHALDAARTLRRLA